MLAGVAKIEFKSEDGDKKDIGQDPLRGGDTAPPAAIYICANCTARVTLTANSQLKCATCEHLTGSSTVFYKVRTEATTYDTI